MKLQFTSHVAAKRKGRQKIYIADITYVTVCSRDGSVMIDMFSYEITRLIQKVSTVSL